MARVHMDPGSLVRLLGVHMGPDNRDLGRLSGAADRRHTLESEGRLYSCFGQPFVRCGARNSPFCTRGAPLRDESRQPGLGRVDVPAGYSESMGLPLRGSPHRLGIY